MLTSTVWPLNLRKSCYWFYNLYTHCIFWYRNTYCLTHGEYVQLNIVFPPGVSNEGFCNLVPNCFLVTRLKHENVNFTEYVERLWLQSSDCFWTRIKITNVEVLKRAGLPSLKSILIQMNLRWLGHVERMDLYTILTCKFVYKIL